MRSRRDRVVSLRSTAGFGSKSDPPAALTDNPNGARPPMPTKPTTKLTDRCLEIRRLITDAAAAEELTTLDLLQLESTAGYHAKLSARRGLAAQDLRPGAAVEFTKKDGTVVHGVLQRLNVKTASVTDEQFLDWRVSPSLLRPSSKPGTKAACDAAGLSYDQLLARRAFAAGNP